MAVPDDLKPIIGKNGLIDNTVQANINFEKGLYVGIGSSIKNLNEYQRIYIPQNDLNSHMLVTGTTRQGKSRFMAALIYQQMRWRKEEQDNIIVYDPKGSEGQEILSWVVESAIQCNRQSELCYLSFYYHQESIKFNPLFGLKNEQVASIVETVIEADEQFYTDVASKIIQAVALGLEFLEEFSKEENPLEYQVAYSLELAKQQISEDIKRNELHRNDGFSVEYYDFLQDAINKLKETFPEKKHEKFDEAVRLWKKRDIWDGNIEDCVPLRSFLNLRDLQPFDQMEKLVALRTLVDNRLASAINQGAPQKIIKLGREAMLELDSISTKAPDYFSKVSTTFSVSISRLTSQDAGEVLCGTRLNPLMDRIASGKGVILIVQPFPMIYKHAANTLGKMIFALFTFMMGAIGASGKGIGRRTNMNIDEAGSVLIPLTNELSNKGGGLGISLYLYTQSRADIEETLGITGSRILFDNMNTKIAFKGNDNISTSEISEMIGDKRTAKQNVTASDNRDVRMMSGLQEERVVSMSTIQKLRPQQFVMKGGTDSFIITAPYQPDPSIKFIMPSRGPHEKAKENEELLKKAKEIFLRI